MKLAKLAMIAAAVCIMIGGSVMAQQLAQPVSVRTAALDYGSFLDDPETNEDTEPSPSDIRVPDELPAYQPAYDYGPGGPWTLFGELGKGLKAGGWASFGATVNGDGNRTGNGNAPLGFNNVADTIVMNQLWLFLEKEADNEGYGFGWGVRFDYVFGADGPDTQSFGDEGWDFGWNSSRDYGSAIPQLYLEVAYNDLTVKLGHFFTIIGNEVVQATGNFFYSHAYTHIYGEPFTHTGFLASYPIHENVTVHAGWTGGWDNGWENLDDASTFLGGVSLVLSDRATFDWALVAGDFGRGRTLPQTGAVGAAGDIYMNSLIFKYQLSDRLNYVFEHDLGNNTALGPRVANNEWYGINQYLFYELNDRWTAGGRIEWFRDDDGARVNSPTAGDGNYYEATIGLNWTPCPNIRVRPELRWDWFEGTGLPYDNGTKDNLFTFGVDGIFTY